MLADPKAGDPEDFPEWVLSLSDEAFYYYLSLIGNAFRLATTSLFVPITDLTGPFVEIIFAIEEEMKLMEQEEYKRAFSGMRRYGGGSGRFGGPSGEFG